MPSSTNIGVHVAYALQLSLGIVFLAAAAPKLRNPRTFASTISGYRIAPAPLVPAIAAALIAVEALLAVAFLTGWLGDVALPLAAAALACFLGAVAFNLRRGRKVPCGCFGDPREEISRRSLARLATLLAAVVALVVLSRTGTAIVTLTSVLDHGAAGLEYLIEMAGAASFLILAGMWVLNLPELASVLRRTETAT